MTTVHEILPDVVLVAGAALVAAGVYLLLGLAMTLIVVGVAVGLVGWRMS